MKFARFWKFIGGMQAISFEYDSWFKHSLRDIAFSISSYGAIAWLCRLDFEIYYKVV